MANSGIVVIKLHTTTGTANLSVNQGHGSQLATFTSIVAKDVHPWESPQRNLGEISVLSVVLTALLIDPCHFFQ